jgi:ABC-type bacteriocin/lantibiotic exporter with double-glycine peptidase domain
MLLLIWLLSCHMVSTFHWVLIAQSGNEPTSWREAVQCGPNALYLFLRLNEWQGDLETVRNGIEVTERGCKFSDLLRKANQLDCPTVIAKVPLQSLGDLRFPLITHHDPAFPGGVGHYFLVTGIRYSTDGQPGVVYAVDPIDCNDIQIPIGDFRTSWSGFVLMNKPVRDFSDYATFGLITFNVLALLWIVRLFASSLIPNKRVRHDQ